MKTYALDEIREIVSKLAAQYGAERVYLFGSCARGDYTEDSDVDIALLTKSNRIESQKYNDGLAAIATEFAMEYFAVVNFICIPYGEFEEKKEWYPYFKNIEAEGKVIRCP